MPYGKVWLSGYLKVMSASVPAVACNFLFNVSDTSFKFFFYRALSRCNSNFQTKRRGSAEIKPPTEIRIDLWNSLYFINANDSEG